MRNQKFIIGALSLFLAFGASAQNEEVDDMYFFESDAEKVKKEAITQPIVADQPSSLSKFSNPDYAGGEEVDTDTYTPTYNYYDNNFSNFNNGFQSGFAYRTGWYRGAYASPFYGNSFYGYNSWNSYSAFYCPPGAVQGWGNTYQSYSSFSNWYCPPGSNVTVSFSVGRSWFNNARWNSPYRYFNSWNNWSYANAYCPPSAYGNSGGTVGTPVRTAQNTVRAIRSNRSNANSGYIATRSNSSPRNYATRFSKHCFSYFSNKKWS